MKDFNLQEALYGTNGTDSQELPSGGEATVKEMTGHEQRNFMNRTKLNNGMAVQELLASCIDTFKGEPMSEDKMERVKTIQNMLSGDRAALMFAIRRFSLGDSFEFATECPECNAKGQWEVDLSDKKSFPVTPYKNGDNRAVEYTSGVREGLKVQFTLLDGNAELAVLRKRNTADLLTDLELRSPKAWDGKAWVPINLNKVPDTLISEMRKAVRDNEGGISTTVKVMCDNCAQEVTFDLLQVPDFMIPSVTS